jgi:T5SS/PEP-CTERM-associated repeat protein
MCNIQRIGPVHDGRDLRRQRAVPRCLTVVAVVALGMLLCPSAARADVTAFGDILPTTDIDDGNGNTIKVPDLPEFGGSLMLYNGEDRIVVGGTGQRIGGTDTGQLTIDDPFETAPLFSEEGIVGGDPDPMGAAPNGTDLGIGLVRILGLNSEWRLGSGANGGITIGGTGQGFVEILNGGRLVTDGDPTDVNADPMGPFVPTNNIDGIDAIIGQVRGSQGFVLLDGFGSTMINSVLSVGHGSNGRIDVLNRARLETRGAAIIGNNGNLVTGNYGDGLVVVDGRGTRWNVGSLDPTLAGATGILLVGDDGRGAVEITNEAIVIVETDTTIGNDDGAFGQMLVDGRFTRFQTFQTLNVGNATGTGVGELHIDNQALARADGATFVGNLGLVELSGGTLLSPTITNSGLIRGDGTVDAIVTNEVTGDIRNAAGLANLRERLVFTKEVSNLGTISTNGGQIIFQGAVTNEIGGQIIGSDAVYDFRQPAPDPGVLNLGQMMFDEGVSDVFGTVTNSGEIAVGHGAVVSFHDTVTDAGGMFNMLAGGVIIFNEDLVLTSAAATAFSILDLGLNQPSQPQLQVAGTLTLGGFLDVTAAGFTPDASDPDLDEFLIASAASITGTFDSISDPVGYDWDVEIRTDEFLQQQVWLKVVADTLIDADFDEDGDVDGDDLANWETGFGILTGAVHMDGDANADGDVDGSDFLAWQRQFGTVPSTPVATAVPEPHAALLALVSLAWMASHGSRRR